ncbi:putative protein phosphatase 2C 23 [Morella rubra]|uniref:PPM-type phosphatase domain-containing protein n=1 Tax=Morella rubra TaxID=262757 RepID=A0A6A1WFQ2_9ROSI|nr:putative protein phosphatase 2C 23 [Morella rubra]
MGSCVLVMLMRGEDVYLMNVGDSRAMLAREAELDIGPRKVHPDLKRINEEILTNHNLFGGCGGLSNLISLQLTTDHSTYVEEEAQRIRSDHPDDSSAIVNDRVKGYLKVTRAFGAGFLKQILDIVLRRTLPILHERRSCLSSRYFIASFPEGDPAQHLIEEVLFRAAKKAGIDFHELLDIPQGERRRYHDDVSVIIISLEGRIWRSSM